MKLADTRRSLKLDRERIDKTLLHTRLGTNEEHAQAALTLLDNLIGGNGFDSADVDLARCGSADKLHGVEYFK